MTAFTFSHINTETNLIRLDNRHIGWVDGHRNGNSYPLIHTKSDIVVRLRDGVSDVDPQSVVDAYNAAFGTKKALAI